MTCNPPYLLRRAARNAVFSTLTIALAAAGLAACGGDDHSKKASASTTPSTTATVPAKQAHPPARTSTSKTAQKSRQRILSPAEKIQLAERVALATARAEGYTSATAIASAGGAQVLVSLPVSEACGAGRQGSAALIARLKQLVPYVRTVAVQVVGTGQALNSYVRIRCGAPKLPGVGRVIYTKSGSGIVDTPTLTIRSSRWTLSYENLGALFEIFISKNGHLQLNPIRTRAPGKGKQSFLGPGHFRLNVAGTGAWTVQVREG